VPFSYTVTAAGVSIPSIKKIGRLPSRIRPLVDLHNGSAALAGTALTGQGGVYHVTIVATFKQGKTRFSSSQMFTLTVLEAPTFKGASRAVAHIGAPFSFTVKTRGFQVASPITETGALPSGLIFTSNGDGTATLAGTASSSDAPGMYPLTLAASNGVGSPASQTFLLRLSR
jgi:large repetitive protein